MPSYFTILTRLGEALEATSKAEETPINFKYIAVGDGNGAATTPSAEMRSLLREVWRGELNDLYKDPANPDTWIAEVVIPESAGGFTIREVGLFTAENIMYLVGNTPETVKPVLSEGAAKSLYIRLPVKISSEANVQILVDPSQVLATRQWTVLQIEQHDTDPDAHPDLREELGDVQDALDAHAGQTNAHGAVSAPTAGRVILRDVAGRAQVAAPEADADIARKDTVDKAVSDKFLSIQKNPTEATVLEWANSQNVGSTVFAPSTIPMAQSADTPIKGYGFQYVCYKSAAGWQTIVAIDFNTRRIFVRVIANGQWSGAWQEIASQTSLEAAVMCRDSGDPAKIFVNPTADQWGFKTASFSDATGVSASAGKTPLYVLYGIAGSQWYNIHTFGISSRMTQIAIQVYTAQQSRIFIRSKHDGSDMTQWLEWMEIPRDAITLTDAAASSALPSTAKSTIASLFQTIRNGLKWLVARFDSSGNALQANKLTTPRIFQVDLSSFNGATFDGTSNTYPGIIGNSILPVLCGGTGASTALQAAQNLGAVLKDSTNTTSSITSFEYSTTGLIGVGNAYQGPLAIIANGGGAATMSFHRAGFARVNFGLGKSRAKMAYATNSDAVGTERYLFDDRDVIPIANGGTGSNVRVTAVQNLFNVNVGQNLTAILSVASGFAQAGYTSLSDLQAKIGVPTVGSAPMPQTVAGVGQWWTGVNSAANGTITIPAGGTWVYMAFGCNDSNGFIPGNTQYFETGIVSGGTAVAGGLLGSQPGRKRAVAWRIT